eukprot:291611_1
MSETADWEVIKYPSLKKPPNSSNILKQGPLQKKGKGMFDGYSTRHFVLKKDGDFAYYSDKTCKNWKGNIDLQTVTKIQRKDKRNIILHTPQRKWYLLSHSKSDLDHWQQLISYIIATEKNRKKKKMLVLRQPKHAPPPKPQLTQSQSDKTLEVKHNIPQPNMNITHSQNNQNNNKHPQLNLPAFNPQFIQHNKEEKNEPVSTNIHETIEYYNEGVSAAYLSNNINITETKVYRIAYLCIWRIMKEENDSKHDDKDALQILMGIKDNKLCFLGGDRINGDYGPLDCVMRNVKSQSAEILSDTIYDQIKQYLSISNERQMFWSGQDTLTVTYFYNMDYDYDMIDIYNEDYSGTDDNLYFDKLYWINWKQIYKYALLHSNPIPIEINDEIKCDVDEIICQIMVVDDIVRFFHDIMKKNDVIYCDDNEQEDVFDPYGLASAPKMSIYSNMHNSGGGMVIQNLNIWQWFDGDTKFEDFDIKSNEKIEHSFLVNPKNIFFITINDIKYKINLKDSTQTNIKTKTVRLLRRMSIKNENINEDNNYSSVFASNGNMLSVNPEWKQKQKHRNELIRYQYMNEDGDWVDYGKELSIQIQIASLQHSTYKYAFTNNKGEECEINFKLMEQINKSNVNHIYPIRKINVEQHID